MSRIRSVHPGLWTDEEFMTLSPCARLLCIGLWNEAFDDGVFEWKPIRIKARLFPADNLDIETLFLELVTGRFIKRGEGDKPIGFIRNFRKYQKPKKPNSSGMLPESEHQYVGLVPNQFPTSSVLGVQREDGGDSGRARFRNDRASSAQGRRKINRNMDPLLFSICEELSGEKVPTFQESKMWPQEILARAVMALEERETANGKP